MVKSVVKPLLKGLFLFLKCTEKSMFTRLFGVFCFGIPWGRCPAPKRRALPAAPHPEVYCQIIITKKLLFVKRWQGFFVSIFCGGFLCAFFVADLVSFRKNQERGKTFSFLLDKRLHIM